MAGVARRAAAVQSRGDRPAPPVERTYACWRRLLVAAAVVAAHAIPSATAQAAPLANETFVVDAANGRPGSLQFSLVVEKVRSPALLMFAVLVDGRIHPRFFGAVEFGDGRVMPAVYGDPVLPPTPCPDPACSTEAPSVKTRDRWALPLQLDDSGSIPQRWSMVVGGSNVRIAVSSSSHAIRVRRVPNLLQVVPGEQAGTGVAAGTLRHERFRRASAVGGPRGSVAFAHIPCADDLAAPANDLVPFPAVAPVSSGQALLRGSPLGDASVRCGERTSVSRIAPTKRTTWLLTGDVTGVTHYDVRLAVLSLP